MELVFGHTEHGWTDRRGSQNSYLDRHRWKVQFKKGPTISSGCSYCSWVQIRWGHQTFWRHRHGSRDSRATKEWMNKAPKRLSTPTWKSAKRDQNNGISQDSRRTIINTLITSSSARKITFFFGTKSNLSRAKSLTMAKNPFLAHEAGALIFDFFMLC